MEQADRDECATRDVVTPEVFNGSSNLARHAVAVFRGMAPAGVLAFGDEAGKLTAFVQLEGDGRAVEYVPFDGATREVSAATERPSPDTLRVRVQRPGREVEVFTLAADRTAAPPADAVAGHYAGRVEACQEAGPLRLDIVRGEEAEAWQLSSRIPGNCSAQASVLPAGAGGHYELALQVRGPRGCSLNGRMLPGRLALLDAGARLLLTIGTDAGGILYTGTRAQA
ncbi:hypothetical protein [Cupriavidus sp. WS]|uniref:hypothetical protein n=1 Tax=Cupriavidus sp. WS TaxID=1312922 RepID=UPI0012DE682F|nr:hypothetical protein [Cupriavidus sp. WS]